MPTPTAPEPRTWNLSAFWNEASIVAALSHAKTTLKPPPLDGDDTLHRVRLRPVGKALRAHLQQSPADSLADLYDPDAIGRTFYKPAEDYRFLAHVPVREKGGAWHQPIGHHRIQVPYRERDPGGRWVIRCREHIIRRAEDLVALSCTPEWKRARFAEATGDWVRRVDAADYRRLVEGDPRGAYEHAAKRFREAAKREGSSFDYGDDESRGGRSVTGQIDQEFIPISGGAYNRQLYMFAHWEQTAKAFEMRHHSELAKAAIGIVSDFVLGRTVSWKVKNQRVSAVWQEFWDRNSMDSRLRQLSDDFSWQGEILCRKFERPKGFLSIRSLDPGAFTEIVTDPQDVESVFYYHQSSPTPWQQVSQFRGRSLGVPGSQYVIQQYPPQEMFHLKNNVSATEKWGRSDFFTSLGTLKRHRDWMNATTLKDMLQANLVWCITIKGDQSDVDAFLGDPTNAQLPAFGGTWVQNEALTLEAMHEDTAGTGNRGQGSTGQFLTALFATAQNMPVSYFNMSAGGTARATALTQSEPFIKKIATRQQQIRQLLDHLYQECMERAVQAGRLRSDELRHEDADPEWIFPSVYEEDRGAKFRDLGTARDRAAISHQTMATVMGGELALPEYSYETEQARIAEERTKESLASWPLDTEAAIQFGIEPPGAQPTPPMMPFGQAGNPLTDGTAVASPAAVKGRGEFLKGADERHNFRAQQQNHPTQAEADIEARDVAFLETADLSALKPGETLTLPSGRVARRKEAA